MQRGRQTQRERHGQDRGRETRHHLFEYRARRGARQGRGSGRCRVSQGPGTERLSLLASSRGLLRLRFFTGS
jgi:hypothetical protein